MPTGTRKIHTANATAKHTWIHRITTTHIDIIIAMTVPILYRRLYMQGGLATDSTWHPYTYAWINVNGVLQYLSETGHITYITYPSAGDIASYRNYAHVAIITGYKGRYIYFDAHTSDRYHMPSPISLWHTYRLH